MNRWLDISVPIHPALPHWPGDPEVRITWRLRMEKGDAVNLSELRLGSHTGTHMDAPLHFLSKAKTLDKMPLDATVGPARVIVIRDPVSIKPAEFKTLAIRRGERILFKTRNSIFSWKKRGFDKNFVYLSSEGAEYLAGRGVRTVGIDYLSIGAYQGESQKTHQILLGAGIWIIEGLNLAKAKPGRYDLVCLPLKVASSEGAPARAILKSKS
jgi:arylformamidase